MGKVFNMGTYLLPAQEGFGGVSFYYISTHCWHLLR